MKQVIIMLLIALTGVSAIIAGVCLLAGAAWGLIATGAAFLLVAAVINRGAFRIA